MKHHIMGFWEAPEKAIASLKCSISITVNCSMVFRNSWHETTKISWLLPLLCLHAFKSTLPVSTPTWISIHLCISLVLLICLCPVPQHKGFIDSSASIPSGLIFLKSWFIQEDCNEYQGNTKLGTLWPIAVSHLGDGFKCYMAGSYFSFRKWF